MAIQKYKDANGNWQNINVKVADTLPLGSVVEYDGTTVPDGWQEANGVVKSKTINGNSGSFGNISLDLDNTKYVLVNIIVESCSDTTKGTPICMILNGNNSWFAHIVGDANLSIITNATVLLKVFYMEI